MIVIALVTVVIGAVFLRETKDVDLQTPSEPDFETRTQRDASLSPVPVPVPVPSRTPR